MLVIAGKVWRGAQAHQLPPKSSPHQVPIWFSYITFRVGVKKKWRIFFVFKICIDSLVPLSVWLGLLALHSHLCILFILLTETFLTLNITQHVTASLR